MAGLGTRSLRGVWLQHRKQGCWQSPVVVAVGDGGGGGGVLGPALELVQHNEQQPPTTRLRCDGQGCL